MKSTQVNFFLSLFCKELSFHLETASARQDKIAPDELAEIISLATKEVLEHYLNGELDMHEYAADTENEYKDIALLSIDSYIQSNQTFEKITDDHANILKEHKNPNFIDFNNISEKFVDIQSHMSHEVKRANKIIQDLHEQVKTLEVTTTLDPLTKTFNRYALQNNLTELLTKHRQIEELFILMIDIDNFKTINDLHGHIAGDKVLIFIAKLLKKTLRDGDKVYRFGGEEFVIILNRTDLEGAQLVSNRILNLCRQNKPVFHNEQITVTLSVGLTQTRNKDTMDDVIHRADTALYRAKNNGKDRMEIEL
ncbi:MAG: GGDEF domain-containing protein [Campylobacterales bacterium]|nr:GGDEF domain-containing protein [Campylobacterales bacterium]